MRRPNRNLLMGIILCACLSSVSAQKISQSMLIVDLNADKGVVTEGDLVEKWQNQVSSFPVKDFSRRDEGRAIPGSGRPKLTKNIDDLKGHSTLVLQQTGVGKFR